MTQQITFPQQIEDPTPRRSRGPGKPFPPITFEEAIFLPKSILEHGFGGEIQRLTLLGELGISPSSSKTRNLISASFRYGLTEGNYNSPSLSVTEAGRTVLDLDFSTPPMPVKGFELAISQFDPFKLLYEKLKGNRLREGQVLHDELKRTGVSEGDCPHAAEIFTANLRFLRLVRDVAGSEYVGSIQPMAEVSPTNLDNDSIEKPINDTSVESVDPVEGNGQITRPNNRPALHIDIQVHIDPTSSAEQIDQIFASMAKHLYGYES